MWDFRLELGLLGGSTRRPVGWAADLRVRQKASLLRVTGTADLAQDLLKAEQQVALSVAYLETIAAFVEKLTGRRWRVGEINGRQSGATNEAVRVAFQRGEVDVVVFTVTEGISLHQNEMPGGERTAKRVVPIFFLAGRHDRHHCVRQRPLKATRLRPRCPKHAFHSSTVVTSTGIASEWTGPDSVRLDRETLLQRG